MTEDSDVIDRELTMSRTIVESIAHEMRANDEVFYMGEDVADYGESRRKPRASARG